MPVSVQDGVTTTIDPVVLQEDETGSVGVAMYMPAVYSQTWVEAAGGGVTRSYAAEHLFLPAIVR